MYESHWGWDPADQGIYSHALLERVPAGIDPPSIRRILDAASNKWWPDRPPSHLWIERLDVDSDAAQATSRVDSELNRPIPDRGVSVRIVLLRYSDGVADLIVVADRRGVDAHSLGMLADALLGRVDVDALAVERGATRPRAGAVGDVVATPLEFPHDRSLEWAASDPSPGPGTAVVDVDMGVTAGTSAATTATLATAAGLLFGRYAHLDTTDVTIWFERAGRPDGMLGCAESSVVVQIDSSPSALLADVVERSSAAVRLADTGGGADVIDGAIPAAAGTGVVGIVGNLAADEPSRYLPCLIAPFPLTLVPRVDGDGMLSVRIYHRRSRVDVRSARQFADHLAIVYRYLGDTDPSDRHRDIDLHVESRCPAAASMVAAPRRIETVFRARVAEQPDAIAIVHGTTRWTYAELNERSERLACGLRAWGVVAGDRVGICVDPSADLVACMLAVWKAGAAYVPMDVRHPPDRLAFTVADAGLKVIVTEAGRAVWGEGLRAIDADGLAGLASAGCAKTGHGGGPDEAAYVIYTSGSTGRPKGVVIPHGNVDALIAAATEMFALGPEDVWSCCHSSAFDFSVWEIWGALLTGARLVIVPYWITRSPRAFHQLLVEQGVTVLSQTPTAFAQLAPVDPDSDQLCELRLVVFGGEPLDARRLVSWLDRYPESRCRLVNMYGITETTVHVTAQTVSRREALSGSRSVGRPLDGWAVDVLDERGRPAPVGVSGEIYVGGAGLALGYLNRPGLTAQRFVVDPRSGHRLYRTGDRGRIRLDGALEHLGRLDTQVQIRGFRVELDEVRHVLLDDSDVAAAAVVLGGDSADTTGLRIDAYVVLAGQGPSAIRSRAARYLPEHMMPATITVLQQLPPTTNGKLDVTRLPEPTRTSATGAVATSAGAGHQAVGREQLTGEAFAGPLTEIWEMVLEVPVGLDDNLFELGGNSLCAIHAETRMRDRGLPDLPMRELYLRPTVRGICATLAGLYPEGSDGESDGLGGTSRGS